MSLQFGIPLFLIAGMLQAAIMPHLRIAGAQPDLIVILVLAWAILDHAEEGVVWAFVGGLFLDLFSGAPPGFSSLLLIPISYVVGFSEAQVYRKNLVLPVLLTAGSALVYHVAYLILLRFFLNSAVSITAVLWSITLPSVLFDVILIIPALSVLGGLYDRLHPRRVSI